MSESRLSKLRRYWSAVRGGKGAPPADTPPLSPHLGLPVEPPDDDEGPGRFVPYIVVAGIVAGIVVYGVLR